ncbi:hypothetical protein ACTQ45_04810 [Fundicoccus sp. Sow4_D5]|uniref:hypothetical protein n=1 Tax=Fundicoccus sp. Sow4_D5 TaxID=3438782 RepID=UPI003F93D80B
MTKKNLFYSLFGLLLILAIPAYWLSQDGPTQEVTASTFEASIVEPFKVLEALEEFRITDEDEEYVFTSDGEKLVSADLPAIEEEALWDFIAQVISLQALTLEKAPEHTSLEKMTRYTFTQDENYDITLELYALANSDSHIGVVTQRIGDKEQEDVLEFPNLPLAISDFSLLYLEAPLDLGLGSLIEVAYQDTKNDLTLSQESDWSHVERSPFISGWFLHDVYQTDFSVEYKQMESFLTTLKNLHAQPLPDFEPATAERASLSLSLMDDAQQTSHLAFYPHSEENLAMYWQEKDAWYAVPQGLVNDLTLDPQALIDNFIALIPLDAVETITFDGLQNMTINHLVETIGEGELAEEHHEFSLDGHLVEEVAFRKVYQYLAALSYQDLIPADATMPEEASLTLTYQFESEGETLAHVIHFYDVSEESYAVEKNGVLEFTASKAQIDDMLTELAEFN